LDYILWNKGADPNLWSWVENTPKGVTIHYVDEGIDTGPIIASRIVYINNKHTLRTSYDFLHFTIQDLFIGCWEAIKRGEHILEVKDQPTNYGSTHKAKDKEQISLPNGWDTLVSTLLPRY
jgi:methionyl-tRNA formyltransferase